MEQPRTNSQQPSTAPERPRGEGVQLGPKGQYVSNLPRAVKVEVERYRIAAGTSQTTPFVPHAAIAEHTEKLRGESTRRLRQAYDAAETEYNEKAAGFKKILRPQPTDTNVKLLASIERDRAWRRIKAIIDSDLKDPLGVIQEESRRAGLSGDLETLNALEEELPAYFRSKQMDEKFASESARLASNARALTYSPEQHEAAKQLKQLDKVWYRSKMAYEHGNHALNQPVHDEAVIPDAVEGQVLSIGGYRATSPKLPGLDD